MPGLLPRLKLVLALMAILAAVLPAFSGCSTAEEAKVFISERLSSRDDMDAAVEVVDRFFALIMENDLREAYTLISESDRNIRYEKDFINEFEDVTEIVKVEINWVEVNNNIATVGIDLIDTYDGDEKMYKDIEVSLIKEEDGSWKIVFWD
jgi:hypothetical protein